MWGQGLWGLTWIPSSPAPMRLPMMGLLIWLWPWAQHSVDTDQPLAMSQWLCEVILMVSFLSYENGDRGSQGDGHTYMLGNH